VYIYVQCPEQRLVFSAGQTAIEGIGIRIGRGIAMEFSGGCSQSPTALSPTNVIGRLAGAENSIFPGKTRERGATT